MLVAIPQWQSVGLVIEKLLKLWSIPELAMRRVLGKDTLRVFPTGID